MPACFLRKFKRIAFVALVVLAISVVAGASRAATRFSLIEVHPDPIQNRYFFMQGTDTLPKYAWTLGTFFLYYNQLLDIDRTTTTISRRGSTSTSQRVGGMEHLFYQYLYGAFGVTDRFTLMFDFPFFWYYKYGLATTANTPTQWYRLDPGDLRFSGKVTALRLEDYPVGLSFFGAVSAPTGTEGRFLGDEGPTGEVGLVVEGRPLEKFYISFNTSFQTREHVDINDITFRDYIKFSLGANYKVVPNVGLIAEVETHTAANNAFGSKKTTPTEARVGARWFPGGGGWVLGVGGSVGIIYGKGMPRAAGFINVGYTSKRRKDFKRVDVPGIENEFSVVYFGFDSRKLTDADIEALDGFIDDVAASGGQVTIDVYGWADPVGPARYNKRLSLKRAEAVATFIREGLVERGNDAPVRALGIGENSWVPRDEARRADVIVATFIKE